MSNGIDLGTYFVKVEFTDGQGFIYEWNTNGRFLPNPIAPHSGGCVPLQSLFQKPPWKTENDLIDAIIFMFTFGNYSCDCNRYSMLARTIGKECDPNCGNTLVLKSLTLIRPDGETEVKIL